MKYRNCVLGLVLCGAGGVIAQTNAVVQADVTTNAPTELEKVVVSATSISKYRTDTVRSATLTDMPPEQLPVVVDVLTEDFIRDRNPTDLDQLLTFVPGVYQGGKSPMSRTSGQYTIRGMSGSEALLNGTIPLGNGPGTFLDPAILERVEIAKGPVGSTLGGQTQTLGAYGAGGSVILYQKRPQPLAFQTAEARASFGENLQRYRITADINEPLVDEKLLGRVPVSVDISHPFWLPSGYRWGESYTMAPSFILQPSETLRIGLDTLFYYADQPGYQGILVKDGKPAPGFDWDTDLTEKNMRDRYSLFSIMPWAEWNATENWMLRGGGGFSWNKTDYNQIGPPSLSTSTNPYDLQDGTSMNRRYNGYLHSIYTLDTEPVRQAILVGVDTLYRDNNTWGRTSVGGLPLATPTKSSASLQKYGFILQDQADFYEDLHALIGARYDYHISANDNTGDGISPRVGLSYSVLEWLIPFANVSYTEAPNFGYYRKYNDPSTELTDTWSAWQYEAGVRVSPAEGFWISASVFQIDQDNTPVLISGSGATASYGSEGETRSRGFELSATGNLTKNWSVFGSYTYIDYKDITAGTDFDRFPPNALSLFTTYRIEELFNGTVVGFGYRFRDSWLQTEQGRPVKLDPERYRIESANVFDFSVEIPIPKGWFFGESSFSFAIKNIFDDRYIESARNLQCFPGDPRTFELALRCRF